MRMSRLKPVNELIGVCSSSVSDSLSMPSQIQLFSEEKPLLGRNNELQRITNVYEKVCNKKLVECVVVHGESGTGKTCLVQKFQETVMEKGAYFCTGKYFQDTKCQEPYSAIIAAFSDLCDLMLQSKFLDDSKRKSIQHALGSDGHMLARCVTNISPFLDRGGPRFEITEAKSETAFANFQAACISFLRAMSSEDHPLVLFFDDVQWMDSGSKALLHAIFRDTEMECVMLIMAYRDEDEGNVENLFPHGHPYVDIALANLDLMHVYELVNFKLGSSSLEINALSEVINKKTSGNPFHILEFLSSIKEEGLMSFDKEESSWLFDTAQIQRHTMISDSLAELLSKKLQRLGSTIKDTLKVASLLGYSFSEDMVIDVMSDLNVRNSLEKDLAISSANVLKSLKSAADHKILETTRDGYQFSHDKLQAAFTYQLSNSDKGYLHLSIGKHFLRQSSDTSAHQAAVHLNRAKSLNVTDAVEGASLAQINLEASKYCESKFAFSDSLLFLRHGLSQLEEGTKWQDNFDLAFEMTKSLGRLEYIMGNFDASLIAIREVVFRGKSIEAKINPLVQKIDVLISADRIDDVIKEATGVLKELGIHIPNTITPIHVFRKLQKVRRCFKQMTDQEILRLPTEQNSKLSAIIKILVRLCDMCMLQMKVIKVLYTGLLATELTLENGLSPYSPVGIALCGFIELTMGQSHRAFRLGNLSLEMHSKIPNKEVGCILVTRAVLSLLFLKVRLKQCSDLCTKALDDALQIADPVSITIVGPLCTFFVRLFSGCSLSSLESFLRTTHRRLISLGYQELPMVMKPYLQLVLTLQHGFDESNGISTFSGEIMDEKLYLEKCDGDGWDMCFVNALYICKMLLLHTFGFYNEVYKLYADTNGWKDVRAQFGYLALQCHFYHGISSYRLYRSTGMRKYIRGARKCEKMLALQESSGNPNAAPLVRILQVEALAAKSKNKHNIQLACRKAIQLQKREGLVHLEALANEQASRILGDFGCYSSFLYLDSAMALYKYNWGSRAKYDMLGSSLLYKRDEEERDSVVGTVVSIPAKGAKHISDEDTKMSTVSISEVHNDVPSSERCL